MTKEVPSSFPEGESVAPEPGSGSRPGLPQAALPVGRPGSAMARQFVQDATGGVAGHPVAGIAALILFMDLVGTRPSLVWFGAFFWRLPSE